MRRSPEPSRPAWLRYGIAAATSAAALLLTDLLWPIFRYMPNMPSFLAVFLVGWIAGGGPSLLTLGLCTLGILYFFYTPVHSLRIQDTESAVRLAGFVFVGLAGAFAFSRLWASRRRQAELIEQTDGSRLAAESARRALEEILESITDGFYALDRAYRFTYVNRQAEEILSKSREHLLGKSALEDSPASAEAATALRRAMEEGRPSHAQQFSDTLGRWLASDVYPTPDGVSVLFRDITDRRQSQEELRRLASIVESSEDAIIAMGLDGVITAWNEGAERLLGYASDEMIGRGISLIMPPERRRDEEEILGRIRGGERVEHFETVRLRKNGERVPVSLSVSPVKDASGNIIGAAKIARDITEKKRSEEERERLFGEAQEAARVREEFLSVAGHELRTPLTTLQFQMHTIRRRLAAGQPDKAAEVLVRARGQLERLVRLTEELLDVTRITSGRLALEREEMDLADVAREAAERHRDAAARNGSELRIEAKAGGTGLWDRSRLDQVMTNLLSNAVKFGSGKPIEILVEPDTAWARCTVRDHGIGISPEDQSRIFDRFERAVSGRSYGGLGLGLWISRQIVDAHGGRIEVASAPGEGSTFRIELPRGATKGAGG